MQEERLHRSSFRILIADDNGIMRKGIAAVVCNIMPGSSVLEVSSFHDAKKRLGDEEFRAAIFDVDMRDLNGPRDFLLLRADHPHLILAVLSRNDNVDAILAYLAVGVNGYIHECCNPAEIEHAIRAILSGIIYVPPTLVRPRTTHSNQKPLSRAQLASRSAGKLTSRQKGVLELLLNGRSNKEIARDLDISPNTVKIHVSALLRHFVVHTRADLLTIASQGHAKSSGSVMPRACSSHRDLGRV